MWLTLQRPEKGVTEEMGDAENSPPRWAGRGCGSTSGGWPFGVILVTLSDVSCDSQGRVPLGWSRDDSAQATWMESGPQVPQENPGCCRGQSLSYRRPAPPSPLRA